MKTLMKPYVHRKTVMTTRVMSGFMVSVMAFQKITILEFYRIEKITMPNESALIVLKFRPRQTLGDLKTYCL